eukprot:5899694-Pleurochrysis_carterae.AAC.2
MRLARRRTPCADNLPAPFKRKLYRSEKLYVHRGLVIANVCAEDNFPAAPSPRHAARATARVR